MNLATIQTVMELDERVKAATGQFHNSAVAASVHDPALGHVFAEIELSVADIILVAILGQVHLLVTGPTGRGKTDLVKLICQGVFGDEGWHLLRLNPHLTEETFADINTQRLAHGSLREAISPAPFLSKPCTVFDECNRCPAALTNVLLGFCDGRLELKCGLKYDVGYSFKGADGGDERYHLAIGTMNEGKEYTGTFGLDPALARRFCLRVPFGELRPTSDDIVEILSQRSGHARLTGSEGLVEQLAETSEAVRQLHLDPLAFVYLAYLCNVGRCPHSPTGFHPDEASELLCAKTECRIQKVADGFCSSVGGLSEGVAIFLKRAACAMAALRAARTVRAIQEVCEAGPAAAVEALRGFVGLPKCGGNELVDTVARKYVAELAVGVQDVRALLPFVGLGGKIKMAEPYVAKQFSGSEWLAIKHFTRQTYANLESFFREHNAFFQSLASGNGAVQKLRQRLEYAEKFSDPVIRHAVEPFLDRRRSLGKDANAVAEEIRTTATVEEAASHLLGG